MKRNIALVAGVVLCLGATSALAQVEIRLFPPAVFRATARPQYYEGHANYYYRGRWYYREGREWRNYREEPRELQERRGGNRQHYERRHR